jgi:hypothetical protein
VLILLQIAQALQKLRYSKRVAFVKRYMPMKTPSSESFLRFAFAVLLVQGIPQRMTVLLRIKLQFVKEKKTQEEKTLQEQRTKVTQCLLQVLGFVLDFQDEIVDKSRILRIQKELMTQTLIQTAWRHADGECLQE